MEIEEKESRERKRENKEEGHWPLVALESSESNEVREGEEGSLAFLLFSSFLFPFPFLRVTQCWPNGPMCARCVFALNLNACSLSCCVLLCP